MNLHIFKRSFTIVSYTMQHGLLLRSGKNKENKIRIDILFENVVGMESRMSDLHNLIICEEKPEFLNNVKSKPIDIMEKEHKVYSLTCDGWVGFVVASNMMIYRDKKEFFEPSFLLHEYDMS